jgi:hypothetical protein
MSMNRQALAELMKVYIPAPVKNLQEAVNWYRLNKECADGIFEMLNSPSPLRATFPVKVISS